MVTAWKRWFKQPRRWVAALLVLATQPFAGVAALDELAVQIRSGDTLIGISQRYLEQPARWPELKRLNRLGNDRRLRPGALLRIPLGWLRWSELTAEVVYVNGAVTGSLGPLAAGMRLKAGDSFDTGTQGTLTLRLSDGAIVVFAPMTQAGLGVAREAPATGIRATVIDLQSGSAESTVTPPASRFEIRTPRVVTAVRGTRFRVAADADTSRHEVLSGQVAVTASGQDEVRVAQGQGVRSDAGRLGALVTLLAAPDLSGVAPVVERTAQRIEVAPLPGARAWRWQVADDAAFTRLLQDAKTPTPVWLLTGLADGDYFLRVRAADEQALEGNEAQMALAVRARPEPPLHIAPPSGASVVAGSALVWAELAEAQAYHLQVAHDAQFKDLLLDRAGIIGARVTMEPAWTPGRYYWRLATQRKDGTRGPFGDAATFTILAPSSVAPPELGDAGLRLTWSGPAGFSHRVQLSTQADFSGATFDQVVSGASLELPKPPAGTYHVRTQVVLPDGSVGAWSSTQRFEVPQKPASWQWPWLLLFLLPFL